MKRLAGWQYCCCFLMAFLLGVMSPAMANNFIEMDGNAIDNADQDWQTFHNGNDDGSAAFSGIIADPAPLSIFTGGGSKDINDIPSWKYRDGSVPDKNDLTNGYAAGKLINGDLVLHFGADRYANNGDAIIGFWFFQDQVGLGERGAFVGEHQEGDIFVVMEFPQGSTSTPYVQVMQWVNSGGNISNNLQELFSTGDPKDAGFIGALCGGSNDDVACAITNETSAISPWPYLSKTGATDFPPESFFEGFLNVSAALQLAGQAGATPCFSSFMVETRSSRSVTAQLKDFVLGRFPLCGIDVSKTCDVTRLATVNDDTDRTYVVDFQGLVTNSGAGTFPAGETLTVIDDAGTPDDTSDDVTLTQTLLSAFAPGQTLSFNGSFFSDENPPTNTVDASLTFGAATVSADPYSIQCQPLPLTPGLWVDKDCSSGLVAESGQVVLQVGYDIAVCNTGEVPLSVELDDPTADYMNTVLLDAGLLCETDADCGEGVVCRGAGMGEGETVVKGVCDATGDILGSDVCFDVSGDYQPSTVPSGDRYQSSNTVTATGSNSEILEEDIEASASDQCNLCPGGS